MLWLVISLLAFDLRALGFNYPNSVAQNSRNVEVIVYNTLDEEKCPKVVQPLCGTNGKEFLYFENKCHFDVKNYKTLIQGLMEYFECPLSYCKKAHCPPCDFVHEPVCAIDISTGVRRTFRNPCEVKRRMCKTRREWCIISFKECYLALKPDCPEFCTLEYKPVCARFMGLEKEFSNECELQTTICQTKQKWHIVRQGTCAPAHYKTVTEFYALDSECFKICASDYKPICAKLQNKLKVFRNKCELENSKCLGQDWQVVKEGACLEDGGSNLEYMACPKFCTKDYRPLCAEYKGEQREFGNSCELVKALCETRAEWKVIKLDRCSTSSKHNLTTPGETCPMFCSREYKPVCAKFKDEIKEFANKCLLKKWNCNTDKKWEMINVGPCSSDFNDLFPYESKCRQFCSNEHRPVCAEFDAKLREFRNKCQLEKTSCETDTNWKVFKEGHCPFENPSASSCPKFCTKEFNPVCASYNGELREFSNACELRKNSCETKIDWQIEKMGSCSNLSLACPQFCPEEYRPVCATYKSKLRLFNNKCEMAKAACETKTNWKFLKNGNCPSYVGASCPEFCTREFRPVCAQFRGELREFYNSCELKKSSCETLTEWELVGPGPCRSSHTENHPDSLCENEPFDPICAHDYFNKRTFNNLCQLADEMKRSKKNWSILHKGICRNTSPIATTTNPPTTNILLESTTAARTTTLKSIECNTTESITISEETTKPPTTTSDECARSSSGEKGKKNYNEKENGKEYKKETVPYTSTVSSSSQETTGYTLSYNTDLLKTSSHSYESKSSETYAYTKAKNYKDNYENKDTTPTSGERISTEIYQSYSVENYATEKSAEENEPSQSLKYPDDPKNHRDKIYFENSEIPKNDLRTPISYNSKDPPRRLSNKRKSNSKYFDKARLNEWLKKQIEVMLTRVADSQSYEESGSDEKELYNSLIAKHLNAIGKLESDENLEANRTKENYGMGITNSQQIQISPSETKTEKLATLNNKTSVIYLTQEQYDSKHNSSKPKKGEVYNGVVYKAPVYDAPTYNIIYTAPFHYHGFGAATNSTLKNASSTNESPSKAATSDSSHPLHHFFSSLAATNVGFAKPNFFPGSKEKNNSYMPQVPPASQLSAQTYNNNLDSSIANERATEYPEVMLRLPLPRPKTHNASTSVPSQASSHSRRVSYPPLVPQQFALPAASESLNSINSPQISLNSTLLNKIIETLKIITNRY